MSHPHLDRAPIVEAIVDFRVAPELSSLQILEPFKQALAADFPDQKRVFVLASNLDVSDEDRPKVTTSMPEVKGYACWAADRRRVVQARVNGFSFSHLAPYNQWSVLRDDARAWWVKYRDLTGPERVTRCALRFVNRLELPLPMRDLSDYLRTLPEISRDLPQTLSGLFMRLVVPFGTTATAIIIQAVEDAAVTPQKLPVILDIDVFRDVVLAPDREDDMWTCMEELRTVKNEVFFKSLTQAGLNLFT
jgi:uncharacterized protein (TIGR04255 family)